MEMDDISGYGGFTVNEPAPNTIYYRQDTQRQSSRYARPTIADLHSRFTVCLGACAAASDPKVLCVCMADH